MIAVDQKVVDMIRKVRAYLKEDKLTMEAFPLESIMVLVENTLGDTVWKCIGSMKNEAFQRVPELYGEWFADLVKRSDKEGCIRLLELFENTYKCFYTAVSDMEKDFREGPYRKMIRELGDAYAQVQHRLHLERQSVYEKEEKTLAAGKGVVYTCLFGKEEGIQQPTEISAELDYICFTDREELLGTREGIWEFCRMKAPEELKENEQTSYCRIFAHKILSEYDYSIWTEHHIKIVGDVCQFAKAYGNGNSLLGFSQCGGDCIYDNIDYTGMCEDDSNIAIRKRMKQYEKEGYPKNNGLIDGCILIRNHRDSRLCRVMEEWWKEAEDSAGLGDNCFNYVAWKNDFPFALCNLFVYYNPYFKNIDVDLDIKGEEY